MAHEYNKDPEFRSMFRNPSGHVMRKMSLFYYRKRFLVSKRNPKEQKKLQGNPSKPRNPMKFKETKKPKEPKEKGKSRNPKKLKIQETQRN